MQTLARHQRQCKIFCINPIDAITPPPPAATQLSSGRRGSGVLSAELGSSGLFSTQAVQVISPCLHHLPTLWQVLCTVVCRFDGIPLGVCQLPLDGIRGPAHLMQQGGSHTSEAMTGHIVRAIAKAPKRGVHRVLAHRITATPYRREHIAAPACSPTSKADARHLQAPRCPEWSSSSQSSVAYQMAYQPSRK